MAKIIAILSIVLPFLILVLGLIRYYTDGKKNFGGLINFLALLLLLMGLFSYFFLPRIGGGRSGPSGPPPPPLPVSKHSEKFNNSMGAAVNAYFKLTDAFVKGDTAAIRIAGLGLQVSLDSISLEDLKKDTTGIYESALDPLANAKSEVSSILSDPSLTEKRGSLNILSDQLRTLWVVVRYDREKAFWMECPDAFGEDKPGNWLSRSEEPSNPYASGEDKARCGESRATIEFAPPADSTKKTK